MAMPWPQVPPGSTYLVKGRAGGNWGAREEEVEEGAPKQEQAHTGPATQATTGTRRPEEN